MEEKTTEVTSDAEVKEDDVLTSQNEGDIKVVEDETTKDEEINSVGSDVPTVEPPKPPKPPKKKKKKAVEPAAPPVPSGPTQAEVNVIKAAVRSLVGRILTPSDVDDFKALYPSLFE
ncbi:MAG: hypothetical protein ACXADB_00565 [Candidatus Hermodarchaeia archaeon]|jgi:hypothetical protein